jgi:hypothetical protein
LTMPCISTKSGVSPIVDGFVLLECFVSNSLLL